MRYIAGYEAHRVVPQHELRTHCTGRDKQGNSAKMITDAAHELGHGEDARVTGPPTAQQKADHQQRLIVKLIASFGGWMGGCARVFRSVTLVSFPGWVLAAQFDRTPKTVFTAVIEVAEASCCERCARLTLSSDWAMVLWDCSPSFAWPP